MANPFDDDFDDKDKIMGSYSKPTSGDQDNGLAFYEQRIEDALQRSLASTGRSLVALQESEEMGVNTAQDLIVQGEKLQNVEQRLSTIQETTRQTQRHLNSVKSVFGSIRNYFNKDKSCTAAIASIVEATVSTKGRQSSLPTTLDSINANSTAVPADIAYGSTRNQYTLPESSVQAIAGSRWGAMNDEIEDNLGAMESSLQRLKELGLGLNDELKQQNELIDSVVRKAERTNLTVDHQNRQMRRLLGDDKKKTKNCKAAPSKASLFSRTAVDQDQDDVDKARTR